MEKCDACQYVEGLFDSHWRSVSLRNVYLYFFLQAFTSKIQESMQIQELPRISKVLYPWIFLKVLESAWFVGFSGKSLPV